MLLIAVIIIMNIMNIVNRHWLSTCLHLMLMWQSTQLQVDNRLTMLANLQLNVAQKHQPHMTLDVCWHQRLFPDQIMMISTLHGSNNVCDHQKERSLRTLCIMVDAS